MDFLLSAFRIPLLELEAERLVLRDERWKELDSRKMKHCQHQHICLHFVQSSREFWELGMWAVVDMRQQEALRGLEILRLP